MIQTHKKSFQLLFSLLISFEEMGTHWQIPITRNRIGPPMIRCRGHTYRLVIEALV